MDTIGQFDELSKAIARTIEQHIERSKANVGWPQDLKHPILRVDAFLEDHGPDQDQENTPSRPLQVASVRLFSFQLLHHCSRVYPFSHGPLFQIGRRLHLAIPHGVLSTGMSAVSQLTHCMVKEG